MRTLTIVLAVALACTGCGGADDAPVPPTVRHHDTDGKSWMMFYADVAEPEDHAALMEWRHTYIAEPMGVFLGTDEPSEQKARLIFIDYLGTEALAVRTLR
jgi:hypothetical protein